MRALRSRTEENSDWSRGDLMEVSLGFCRGQRFVSSCPRQSMTSAGPDMKHKVTMRDQSEIGRRRKKTTPWLSGYWNGPLTRKTI